MSAAVKPAPAPASHIRRTSIGQDSLPPDYTVSDGDELGNLRASSSADSLPQYNAVYEDAAAASSSSAASLDAGFQATKQLQIQTKGQPLMRLPLPPRPDPIYVLGVAPTGELGEAEYVSVRPARGSGSCFLARAGDPAQTPICTTTYRFGPNRPPKIQLLEGHCGSEEIVFECKGSFTRATTMRTPLGTFEWRYSTRAERRAAGPDVDSLLILDRTTTVPLAGGGSEVRRRKVGQLVRAGGLRTEGTRRSTAGNGGRLMLDLREWADRKAEADQMELLAVASCVSMLKKEVDRRRFHQTMVIMGAASGGA
ncbi:hypothetical protein B0J13DRAFT_653260 [Dactylonectria estremocensis]|uniref:Uncharacterized protein n=1 Tax=Dactylonectria estremocensis TaxID=1079267 RepID=A0A9P9DCX0_9HYPO|nr:hypothetical protein B0J13DRAFT_653260 [Dactylonectria estremocensis]